MEKWQRLSRLERVFLPNVQDNARSTNIVLSLKLSLSPQKSLSCEYLEIALRRAVAQHYRLCCAFAWDAQKHNYDSRKPLVILAEKASGLPINFRCWQADTLTTISREALVNYEVNTQFDGRHAEHPAWRFNAILDDKNKEVEVVWSFDHTLGDGLSVALATKSLASELDWVLSSENPLKLEETDIWDLEVSKAAPQYKGLPSYDIGIKNLLGICAYSILAMFGTIRRWLGRGNSINIRSLAEEEKSFPDLMQKTGTELAKTWSKPARVVGAFPAWGRGTTAFSRVSLSPEETLSIREQCRENGTTVTGALLAAMGVAYAANARKRGIPLPTGNKWYMTWTISVSHRGLLPSNQQLLYGNYANMGIGLDEPLQVPSLSAFSEDEFWKLAKQMKDVTMRNMPAFSFSSSIAFYMLTEFSSIRNAFKDSVQGRNREWTFVFDLMNLGNAMEKLFGKELKLTNIQVREATGLASAGGMGNLNQFGVIASSYINSLSASIVADSNLFGVKTQEEVDTFGRIFRDTLLRVADSRRLMLS